MANHPTKKVIDPNFLQKIKEFFVNSFLEMKILNKNEPALNLTKSTLD